MSEHKFDVESAIQSQLSHCGYSAFQRISYEYDEDGRVLTLRGRLPFYYLKQIAQEMVKMVDGVDCVINLIEIER